MARKEKEELKANSSARPSLFSSSGAASNDDTKQEQGE
jgi:hypothetical protein